MIRIVIVDDHPVVRAGLRTVLDAADDIVVMGEAHDHDTAVVAIADLEPDVVVLDVHLGTGPSGLDVLRQVQRSQARPRVLVVTVFDNDIDIDAALAGGAAGYVLKDAPEVDLISAVRAVAAGHQPIDPRVAARVVTRSKRNSDIPSPRELEVLAAVADGHDNATIARDLYISEATVKSHLASVFAKLGVATRTGAVAEARRRGHLR
ncbi:MAG: response regulator transcription factor [Microthrixaceae bacterium]|nr:response regulator transcription factor [Microthrixaceae bacterium]